MSWQVRIVRNAGLRSRIDWGRKLVVFRKPRLPRPNETFPEHNWSQTPKVDGIRCLIGKHPVSGVISCLTTRPTDLREQYPLLDLWVYLSRMLRYGDWIDCELFVPDLPFETIKTALANNGFVSIQSRADHALDVYAFGCSWLPPDSPYPFVNRELTSKGFNGAFDNGSLIYQDGVVHKNSHYGDWVKVKNRSTIDAYVTRILPGFGKYAGQCGSLEVAVFQSSSEGGIGKASVIAAVSGMDDATRAAINKNDIGRVCEVAYERVGSKGRLRHPRFIRWRDDKTASQCNDEQLQ